MSLPHSWSEIFDRFGSLMADDNAGPMWVAQAVKARSGVDSLRDLSRPQRAVVFQKVSGTLVWLEENNPGDYAFEVGLRGLIQKAFARYFDGYVVDGPPWRLDPTEDRPAYGDWTAEADSYF